MTSHKKVALCSITVVVSITMGILGIDKERHTTEDGLIQISKHEACMMCSYQDQGGVWTNGVGATKGLDGTKIKPNSTLTVDEVAVLFARDIKTSELCLYDKFDGNKTVYSNGLLVYAMPQSVFDSLISLQHTVGCSGISTNAKTHKMTQIRSYSLDHNWQKTCDHIKDFVYVAGKVNKGIVNRRNDEYNLCIKDL